ncbi:unnamed protein product [Absidia cylindrospora]
MSCQIVIYVCVWGGTISTLIFFFKNFRPPFFFSSLPLHLFIFVYMSIIPDAIKIDTRIQVGEDRATIRYIGEVEGSSGQWLGVEWTMILEENMTDLIKEPIILRVGRSNTSGSFIDIMPKKYLLVNPF